LLRTHARGKVKHLAWQIGVLSLVVRLSSAQPLIRDDGTGIVNAASYLSQGPPNSSIAQGSIFSIFGSGLGPEVGVQASGFPLETTFHGVSIGISQGATPVAAIPLYVSATQINAVMPSNAPIGQDTLVVTFNGQSSPLCGACVAANVQVIPASFGIFTINQAGNGQGVLTTGKNRLIAYTSPAAPGDVLNIWGTGLGAIQESDTEPPVAGNVGSETPIVYVGGIQVPAAYHGRSPCCSGVDQIQFRVPTGVVGCNVPVAVQIGNVVSNFASIAIGADGETCSDPSGISASDFRRFAANGSIAVGYIGLSRLTSSQVQTQTFFPFGTGTETVTEDYGYGNFEKYPYANFSLTELPLQILNFGACAMYAIDPADSGPTFQVATPTSSSIPGVAMDAGGSIAIDGPAGQRQITPLPPPFPASVGNYGADLGDSVGPNPLYLTSGSYTVTGKGGKDVGPFSVSLQMPEPLTWNNESSINTVTRASGVTVTWTAADPASSVIISGYSNGPGMGFNCTAKASDGQFTVPPIVLLALPPSVINESDGIDTTEASLQIGVITAPVPFTATGLDVSVAISSIAIAKSVTYQ
jgi:uncharacterized protein (TIGR03437 family)